jgi:hypothetical protein
MPRAATITARLNDRVGRATRNELKRTGFSRIKNVICESPSAMTAAKSLPRQVRLGKRASASTNTGQCHRYQEYDSLPKYCSTLLPNKVRSADGNPSAPGIRAAKVPAIGNIAAYPGNLICAENRHPLARIPANPAHPTTFIHF